MIKRLAILSLLASLGITLADFPVHSDTSTVNISQVTGLFDSFNWTWIAANSQQPTILPVDASGNALDFSAYSMSLRMSAIDSSNRLSVYVINTSLTVTSTSVTWSVANTNVPPAGAYNTEILAWQGNTNSTRTVCQGMITIVNSLFIN
jgi:hypothetical protein